MEGRDLYAELGVEPSTELPAIKRAYRDLAIKLHPDKIRDPSKKEAASQRYAKVTEAYRILTDGEAHAEYIEIRERGIRRVAFADRYYYRHTHKYGIPPHNPFKVFVALVLILSALKYGAQYVTFTYYRRAALCHPRYKAWAAAQGDTTGERLKLVGIKAPTWESILAVQIVLLPWYMYRFFRWLVLHVILRRPVDRVQWYAEKFDLSEAEVASLRARVAEQEARAKEAGDQAQAHRRRR